MKIIFLVLGLFISLSVAYGIFFSYNTSTDPEKIYGNWVELNVLGTRQVIINFDKQGVYRNSHLIATRFSYNGRTVQFKTGNGETVYRITGTHKIPQLKRIKPETPPQTLVLEKDEHLFLEQQEKQVLRSKTSMFQ